MRGRLVLTIYIYCNLWPRTAPLETPYLTVLGGLDVLLVIVGTEGSTDLKEMTA